MRKGARLSLDHLAPITERSIVNNHNRKEPPLQKLVKHIKAHKTSISYYFAMLCWIAVMGMVFAGVTL